MVKNWCDLLDLGTLNSALSQEWMNEWMNWASNLYAYTNSGQLKITLIIFWVVVVKDGNDLLGYGTLLYQA